MNIENITDSDYYLDEDSYLPPQDTFYFVKFHLALNVLAIVLGTLGIVNDAIIWMK